MTITLPGNQAENEIIVRSLLKAPTVIAGRVIDPNIEFLSNYLFGANVPTPSGQVQYQVAKLDDEYAARGDAKIIQPGSRFPTLDIEGEAETNGHTEKYGASYIVSYEAVDRNDILPMREGNRKLRNHIVRLDALRALTAIDSAVAANDQTVAASATWDTERAAFKDLGKAQVSAPTGYTYDTLLLNKQDAWLLEQAPDLQNAWNATQRSDAQIYNSAFSTLSGFRGFNVVINDFVPAGKAYLVDRGEAGFVALEKEFAITTHDQPETERWFVKGSKRAAPFVNQPAAVQVITGIS